MKPTVSSPGLRRFSKLVCFSTFFLIFAGSLVTSTESGLAVPDWPLSYGSLFPPMVGGVFYEHGHRMVASTVGFLTLCMAFWLAFREERKWLRNLGWLALLAVIAQGVLGGITVLFFLPTAVSVSHALLAQTFLVITIVLAYSLSRERDRRVQVSKPGNPTLVRFSVVVFGMIYLQLILGAIMRHTGSGLAVPDFPLMAGQWIPSISHATLSKINNVRFEMDMDFVSKGQVLIHLLHRGGALLVAVSLIILSVSTFFRSDVSRPVITTVLLLDALVVLQITIGMFTIWSGKAYTITSLHVLTGAVMLGISALLILRTAPVQMPRRQARKAGHAVPCVPGTQPGE